MAFCPNCGASVEGKFCAKCGTSVGSAPQAPPPQQPPPGPQAGYQQTPQYQQAPGYQQPPPAYQQPPSYQQPGAQQYSAPAASSGLTENVAGALCYLIGLVTGILFLVIAPYNQSKFVRFHAFQAIFWHIAMIVIWIGLFIIGLAMPFGLHVLFSLFYILLWLGFLAAWLILMFKAYNNEKFKLPIIGDLAEKQS